MTDDKNDDNEWKPLASLLRYVGGKSKLANQIVQRIPPHLAYVELFAGGAWVFFRKQPSKVEVLNDLDGELINFWRVLQNHAEEFLRCCRQLVPSREIFEDARGQSIAGMTDIQRAARYYYLQRLAFGGNMKSLNLGTSAVRPPAFHLASLKKSLPKIQQRLRRVLIEHLDAIECLQRYDRPSTFFYLDPPYWGVPKYRQGFGSNDYERLAAALAKIKGKFLMTLNDCNPARQAFSGFTMETVTCGSFIANTRGAKNARPTSRQLFIHNLALVSEPQNFPPLHAG